MAMVVVGAVSAMTAILNDVCHLDVRRRDKVAVLRSQFARLKPLRMKKKSCVSRETVRDGR